MTRIAASNHRLARSQPRVTAALLVAGALGFLSVHAFAEESANLPRSFNVPSTAQLERAYWACDYAATTRWVGGAEGAMCVAIYEELKRTKFNGSFPALLSWWQQNKAAEHRALATVSSIAAAR